MTLRPRDGAALVLALLIVIVVEVVVVGTVHLAMQERRIAHNAVAGLRVRLAAEAAVRAAAAHWPPGLDSLTIGQHLQASGPFDTTALLHRTTWQSVDAGLLLVTAEVIEPPPGHGRARAAVLLRPPLLPLHVLPAAALTAAATVQLSRLAQVAATPDPLCTIPIDAALLVTDSTLVQVDPAAMLSGGTGVRAFDPAWPARIQDILLAGDSSVVRPGSPLTGTLDGVVVVDGDLVVGTGSSITGVLLVNGSLLVEAGVIIHGSVIATGSVSVEGTVLHSACVAHAAVRAARLHRPRPHATRPVLPAF